MSGKTPLRPPKVLYIDIETWAGVPDGDVYSLILDGDLTAKPVQEYLSRAVDPARAVPLYVAWRFTGEEPRVLRFLDTDTRQALYPSKDLRDDLHKSLIAADYVVGHNVGFDLGVLRRAVYNGSLFDPKVIPYKLPHWKDGRVRCTLEMFNVAFDGGKPLTKRRSLSACCRALGIPYTKLIPGGLVPEAMARTLCSSPAVVETGWRDLQAALKMVAEDVGACEALYLALEGM